MDELADDSAEGLIKAQTNFGITSTGEYAISRIPVRKSREWLTLVQRQWKDIKHKYMETADEE